VGFDKSRDKLNKGEDMGLDQHAHIRGTKIDWDKFFSDDTYSEKAGVFVWRKHARLQEFMARKWAEQNPKVEVEGALAHLGFNADQEAPCYMTEDVVKELGEQIQKGFADYHAQDGFFWGQQFQEESVKDYKEQDLKFLKFCEQAINEKKVVEYWCSW
tara:strand:- start:102 stop:575 length:474 start_codon:yes stop_codon:yes gene_type:complete